LGGIGFLGSRTGKAPAPNPKAKAMEITEFLAWRAAAEGKPAVPTCVAMEYEPPVPQTPSRPSVNSKGGGKGDRRNLETPMRTPKGPPPRRGRSSEDFERPAPEVLEVSSSSWVSQQRSLKNGDQDDVAVMTRKIRAVLNKLTLEKFGVLLQQLMDCGIATHEDLTILMHEIMEKATTQHHFIAMYTDLCVYLQEWSKEKCLGDKEKGSFKRILLLECQASFERYLKPPEHLDELKGEEKREAEHKYKTAMLGNIKFVGALLAKNMVASQVILSVCGELMKKPYVAECLECLAAFLTSIGGMFDKPEWKYINRFKDIFHDLRK
jgi:hypothetical protein